MKPHYVENTVTYEMEENGQNSTVDQQQHRKDLTGSPSLLPPILSRGAGGHGCSQSRLRTRTLFSPSGNELEFASTFRVQLSRMSFPLSAKQHQYFQKNILHSWPQGLGHNQHSTRKRSEIKDTIPFKLSKVKIRKYYRMFRILETHFENILGIIQEYSSSTRDIHEHAH